MSRSTEVIEVFNRYTRSTDVEAVYGEGWLRWTYESVLGRLALAAMVKRGWFSRWYGWKMSRPASAARIRPFIQRYGVNADEFAEPVAAFGSFNEFFFRRLKPSARPIVGDAATVVFPADGRHLGFPNVGAADRFYAKGQSLDLIRLLGDGELARRFERGSLVISRLCPVDYHRFHFPCDGRAGQPWLINGDLYSVNPVALARNLGFLGQNKRFVTMIEETPAGTVLVVEIGATCVGSIVHTAPCGRVAKGAEKGYFKFGGSCVITLFEAGQVTLDEDLTQQTREGRELYARMGDQMGRVAHSRAS